MISCDAEEIVSPCVVVEEKRESRVLGHESMRFVSYVEKLDYLRVSKLF